MRKLFTFILLVALAGPLFASDIATQTEIAAQLQGLNIPGELTLREWRGWAGAQESKEGLFTQYETSATVTGLGESFHTLMSGLTDKQRELLKKQFVQKDYSRLEETLRILQYIETMKRNGQAELYPEEVVKFWKAAASVLDVTEADFAKPAAVAGRPPRGVDGATLDEVLAFQAMMLSGEKALRKSRSGIGTLLTTVNPGMAGESFKDDPEKDRVANEALEAIGVINGSNPDGVLRHEALYTLVTRIPRGMLTEAQWGELASKFPAGPELYQEGWFTLWRMGVNGETQDGRKIRIGVVDNGVDVNHPDLQSSVVKVVNYTNEKYGTDAAGNKHPKFSQRDPRGTHGTMTASVIHQRLPKAAIYMYKDFPNGRGIPEHLRARSGPQAAGRFIKGFQGARKDNVDVVSMSQSFKHVGHVAEDDPLRAQVRALTEAGVPVVVSAGNTHGGSIGTPAHYPEAITVGATDKTGKLAPFSSWRDVIVSENGKLRIITKPDVYANGVQVVAAEMDPQGNYQNPASGNLYKPVDGTSFSTPKTAALAGAFKEIAAIYGVDVPVEELKEIMRGTGSKVDMPIHPLGGRALNPVAAVVELQRRLAERGDPVPVPEKKKPLLMAALMSPGKYIPAFVDLLRVKAASLNPAFQN